MWAADGADHATGAARRRRERRLRAYLKYARTSVAMALAECQHHSAQRPQKARAREEEHEVYCKAALFLLPSRSSSTFSRSSAECGPTCCWSRLGRRSGFSGTPWYTSSTSRLFLQILDVPPVPQMGEPAGGGVPALWAEVIPCSYSLL